MTPTHLSHDAELPLQGVRVVDLSTTFPGPYCTQILHRLGASVTQLEPPEGDSLRWVAPSSFAYLARGKESVSVDLKDPTDHELALTLLAGADVVVEGWRPGVAERLGVSYRQVSALNPAVVYCSLSGYGPTGPLADQPGHDINYAAESGAFDLVKTDGLPVGDLAGASSAAIRILAAVVRAARSGRGSHIELSIAGALREWVEAIGGADYQRFLTVYQSPHYTTYDTSDGERLVIGVAQEPHLWANLITTLGRPDWAQLAYEDRLTNQESIRAFLKQRIGSMSSREIQEQFRGVDTCWTLVRLPGKPARVTGLLPDLGGDVPSLDEHGAQHRRTRTAS